MHDKPIKTQSTPLSAPPAYQPPRCKYCDKKFTKRKKWQKFCSSKHRDAYHNMQKALSSMEPAKKNFVKDFINSK